MRRALAVPAGIGLVLLAFVATLATPPEEVMVGPFPVSGELGEQLVSLHHAVTVHEVALADEVEVGFWEGTTAGVWFVAEATIAGRVERMGVDVDLFVDGVRYEASGRADRDTVDGSVADAGLPRTGPLLIELPADILERPGARSAVLRVAAGGDTRLDSVVELTFDLTQLERVDRLELESARDGDR